VADRYQTFANSAPGRFVARRLGMPVPTPLRRYDPTEPGLEGPVLLGAAPGGRLSEAVAGVLRAIDANVSIAAAEYLREAGRQAGVRTTLWSPDAGGEQRFAALLFDASGIESADQLRRAYSFFHPVVRLLERSGRVLVLATPPEGCSSQSEAVAQGALEGFVRSVAKEVQKGSTANLIFVAPGAEGGVESTLRFFLSARSAYVSGQTVRIGTGEPAAPQDWRRPLAGKKALVTGASRGIGEATAETLARDAAHVVCLDVPDQGDALAEVANRIEGSTLQLDITADDAPRAIANHLRERHGGVDVVVHNAGITRDKTLARMDQDQWDTVIDINLSSQVRINEVLIGENVLHPGGRIVCVSSVGGIAGNRGQVNYATSKAGVIGLVEALAPMIARRPATVNAVAPGFIETQMTAVMPFAAREAGRRMNSLSQGGLPVDVAETVAWLASPGSGGINGSVVRVCGQAILGA
jgi:3-oxoacyl-[acyl-carrier protein] reductase